MAGFEEWRKLGRDVRDELRGSEDFLVARSFGVLRYLQPRHLSAILSRVGVSLPDRHLKIDLWPPMSTVPIALAAAGFATTEPDAHIHGSGVSCLVEAKFRGAQLGYYLNQLGREYLLAVALADACSWTGKALLLVTPDAGVPRVPALDVNGIDLCADRRLGLVSIQEQISQFVEWTRLHHDCTLLPASPDEVSDRIRWCSWADLNTACVEVQRTHDHDPATQQVLEDVTVAFGKLQIESFCNWALRTESLPASGFCPPWRETTPLEVQTFTANAAWPQLSLDGDMSSGIDFRLFEQRGTSWMIPPWNMHAEEWAPPWDRKK